MFAARVAVLETPPRTWRRPSIKTTSRSTSRNTFTDVKKTGVPLQDVVCARKHLHGRGEDSPVLPIFPGLLETPPRTWRRQRSNAIRAAVSGNTSTDVEKTPVTGFAQEIRRKHLHGRGEDLARKKQPMSNSETPPRTWRRLHSGDGREVGARNTSTDVEKTTQRVPERCP